MSYTWKEIVDAFCEENEDHYQEFLEEKNLTDCEESKDEYAQHRDLAFSEFEYNYLEDMKFEEADRYNDWLRAEGE